MESPDPISLAVLFTEANALFHELVFNGFEQHRGCNGAEVERCLRALNDVSKLLDILGVFSSNEGEDDIKTSDLQYLLVDHMVGKLLPLAITSSPQPLRPQAPLPQPPQQQQQQHLPPKFLFDPWARLWTLKRSRVAHIAFLSRCDKLDLIAGPEFEFYESYVRNKDAAANGANDDEERDGYFQFESIVTLGSRGGRSSPVLKNGLRYRTNKIERYTRKRANKERLEQLKRGGAAGSCHEYSGGGNTFEADEELAREYALLCVAIAIQESLEDVGSIHEELAVLERMTATTAEDSGARHGPKWHTSAGMETPPGTALASNGTALDPNRPGLHVTHFSIDDSSGILTSRKENIKAGVFQPSHRLPTMTIEELANIEVAAALERQQKSMTIPASGRLSQRRIEHLEMDGEEDDNDLADDAAVHDRAWDDWKDEHPAGSGNKANKRC